MGGEIRYLVSVDGGDGEDGVGLGGGGAVEVIYLKAREGGTWRIRDAVRCCGRVHVITRRTINDCRDQIGGKRTLDVANGALQWGGYIRGVPSRKSL